jgi:hypothetical protein
MQALARAGWPGLSVLLSSLAALAANLLLPVLWVYGRPGHTVLASDLAASSVVPYERQLLGWPLYACGVAALLGATLVLLAAMPRAGGRHRASLTLAATAGAGAAGFFLALTGSRWVGFYAARLMDQGPTLFHLQAVPYVNLAVGALLLALAVPVVWHRIRSPSLPAWARAGGWVLGACAAALLALPLLPTAVTTAPGSGFHYDELSLETLVAAHTAALAPPEWDRLVSLVDAQAVGAALCLAWGILPLRVPGARWGPAVLAVPLAAATLFAVLFYIHIPDLPGQAKPWPNPIPALALAGLWAVTALGAVRAFRGSAPSAPAPAGSPGSGR